MPKGSPCGAGRAKHFQMGSVMRNPPCPVSPQACQLSTLQLNSRVICMCSCMLMCMYSVYMYICLYVICAHVHVHIYAYINRHTNIYTHKYVYIYIYIYANIHTYPYTHIYIYPQMYRDILCCMVYFKTMTHVNTVTTCHVNSRAPRFVEPIARGNNRPAEGYSEGDVGSCRDRLRSSWLKIFNPILCLRSQAATDEFPSRRTTHGHHGQPTSSFLLRGSLSWNS